MQRAITTRKITPAGLERMRAHQFKKGEGGRPRGSKNVMTRPLRECILEAAARLGSDGKGRDGCTGWLITFAKRHPVPFAQLLARVLPIELVHPAKAEPEPVVYRTSEEIRQELARRGISGQMLRLMSDGMPTHRHTAEPAPSSPPRSLPPRPNGTDHSN